ncbi:carbohydrate binding domain-containing protein [Coraliomargarita algicola]|uniref:Carbohydrate binding domain-containing protein n=1 Tax=Coraliomargarita algicola TaxID=3092156 RepID=A0ABZ0RRI6_9BACT|nr:carbohydrate binding domain-containing protein [Coraliomargarita sp. J2-16]WPJ95554.1 carbohydrate binding domain-containing protein [Coraliomargarita sp. J2-16]
MLKNTPSKVMFRAATLIATILSSQSAVANDALGQLPDPTPYLEASSYAKQTPVFNVGSFSLDGSMHQQASYAVGNKAVFVRRIEGRNKIVNDASVTIYADGKQVGRLSFWGQNQYGHGTPFQGLEGQPEQLSIDETAETIHYRKPYRTQSGRVASFSYTLSALDDSCIQLAYDRGISEEELEDEPAIALNFSSRENHRGKRFSFGGEAYEQMAAAALMEVGLTERRPVSGDIAFEASNPAESYTIQLPAGSQGTLQEKFFIGYGKEIFDIYARIDLPQQTQGSLIIDFGAAAELEQTPPPVGGLDFWKMNGFHVPESPTLNLFPNPSFEQGLRYWSWGDSGWYVAESPPRYDIVAEGLFGKSALILRTTQHKAPTMKSFPLSLDNGKTYTLSFYAKTQTSARSDLRVALSSTAQGGKFVGKRWGNVFGDADNPDAKFTLTDTWQRYSRTFVADGAGVHVQLSGYQSNVLIDGFQLEVGDSVSPFASDPIDGFFTTANPDNDLVFGEPLEAAFEFVGQPNTSGMVEVRVENAYREVVYLAQLDIVMGECGEQRVALDLDPKHLGQGIFGIRADYQVDGYKTYTDYYRMSIMAPLDNTHATKDVMGSNGGYVTTSRGEDLARKFMEWGLGSASHGYIVREGRPTHIQDFQKKYRIANYVHTMCGKVDGLGQELFHTKEVPPELLERIEKISYEEALKYDPEQAFSWAFHNEEEGGYLIRNEMYDEYFKIQQAFIKGLRRAHPDVLIAPTHGTSGYSKLRGYDAIEGYLKAADKQGFKYDAISVHPYWNLDKGTLSSYDLDEETARLQAQMARYGYGEETAIYYPEAFNVPWVNIPQWGADKWGDSYRTGGSPTYDIGNREFIHAASAARLWIMSLKHWPQLKTTNVWISRPFVDIYLSPILMCKASNTLGHLMPWVEFQEDIKPFPGVRGYSFKLEDGSGIAPIWTTNHDVENGLKRGAKLLVKFDQPVEFYDLMGNQRQVEADSAGYIEIPLTPAPLFVKAANVERLTKALQESETTNVASTVAVSMVPEIDGSVAAKVKNLTGRPQSGALEIGGQILPYQVDGGEEALLTVPGSQGNTPGEMYTADLTFSIIPERGEAVEKAWAMDYFYVPKTDGMPDWSEVPTLELKNRYQPDLFTGDEDLKATYQLAWDTKHLYLRVEAEDDTFILSPKVWERAKSEQSLYAHDGSLEVYFDTGANGRTNLAKTYDEDDYRYDFSISKNMESGRGQVWRLRGVNWQFAGGVSMPTKEEAAAQVVNDFQITEQGYSYTITFNRRFLEPIALREGTVAGFALYLHDKDANPDVGGCPKGLSLGTEAGSHCDYKPHLWPLMILADEQ